MAGPGGSGGQQYEAKLASFVRENRLYGAAAAVVHGDELCWAGGAGLADAAAGRRAGPDTLYRIASITKTFTGTAVLQLRDAGKLDLDDPAVHWLPELSASASGPAIERVTIRRLLSHESGLSSEPPGTDWAVEKMVYSGLAEQTLARSAEIAAAIGPNLHPKYSNLGYQLLGEIVRRASGVPYPDYVHREVLEPLGMADTCFDPSDGSRAARTAVGYRGRAFSDELDLASDMAEVWAEGGLWSTVEDLAKWLSFQLHPYGDEAGESPVLAAATLREMHKPRYLSDETWTQAWAVSWYATRQDEVTWVNHSGGVPGFTSNACFDRDHQVGAVVLVNGDSDPHPLCRELAGIARSLVRASAPRLRPVVPTPAAYRPLLGLYTVPDLTDQRRIEWRDGKLVMLSPIYAEPMPLVPAAEPDTFVVGPGFRESGETVRFRRLAGGQVTSVYFGSETLLRLGPVAGD